MLFKSQVYTQASGSVGGVTYSHNRAGLYTRARSVPTNPNTARQQEVRANFATAVGLWDQLTLPQQLAWDAYAAAVPVLNKLGDAIFLTGRARYIQSVSFLLAVGEDAVADAPIFYTQPAVTAITASFSEAVGDVSIGFNTGDSWNAATTGGLAIFISNAQSKNRFYYKGPYLFAGILNQEIASPVTFTPVDPFFEGQKGFVRARAVLADGRLSTSVRTSFTAAA